MLITPPVDTSSPKGGGVLTDVCAVRMEELFGCWQEARRADKVADKLLVVRTALDPEYYENISAVLKEVESASRLLRDLYDLFPIYRSRVPVVLYYLNVILPTLCKSMRDMMIYIDNEELPIRTQWTLMSQRLSDQGGITLAQRFAMYCEALISLIRSHLAGAVAREAHALKKAPRHPSMNHALILPLRVTDPQVQIVPHHAPAAPSQKELEKKRRHWAEKIFNDQPHSTTGLRHRRGSRCFGPPMVESRLGIPPGSTVLFKLPFDKNRLSVTLYLHADGADVTRLLCRWTDRFYNPIYSCYGVHELCVRRKGSSLQFRRWSNNKAHSTLWMALFFKTWERMVLFHAAFVALKARCPLSINVNPNDYGLAGEDVLFRGQIVDDGFEHSLAVIQDRKCGGLRLHAAVWNGELRRCPVWTAFVTYQSASSQWLYRRSSHRIRLKDITPYVFCSTYKKKHQMKHGDFEIYFVDRRAADAFEELFMEEETEDDDGDHVIDVPPHAPDGPSAA
ncbi:Uncharacterized protein BP5553_02238 [Venustampulla echinocandica]|uniref:Uncharacterized protein n=1 Tax=Venustampulla echinocandica TaxID=2656787 RepID=A0A370U396_9HELO|nr:Uncharacterized protein BP5553_02238 [Venustampulla echinocandica]RDL42259.1 Uncharacterized protein BP5553_02238 [Venustampulla echinocandica]